MDPRRAGLLVAVVAVTVVLCRGCVTGDNGDQPDARTPRATATVDQVDQDGHAPGDGHDHPDPGAGASPLTTSASPAAPDYSAPPGDDSEAGSAPPQAGATAQVTSVAAQVAAHWVRHRGPDAATWFARLEPFLSQDTAEALRGADPATVPADRVTAAPVVVYGGEGVAAASVATDTGRLDLRLLRTDRWRVIAISWQRRA